MKLDEKIVKFAGGEANLGPYKMFRDFWNHYRSNSGVKGLEYQANREDGTVISFGEKEEKMNAALRKEIARIAGISNVADLPVEQWATNPLMSWATFAVVSAMIDMILPETIIDSIGAYSDVRTIGWGDSAAFDVKPRDLFVVSKAGRAQRTAEMHKQFSGQVTIVPELREISVMVSLYRVLAGKESLAEFAAKAVRSLESAISVDVYNTFATAMAALPNTPSGYELRIAGYTQTALIQLAQRVTAFNQGAKAIVMGTQLALQSVLPSDANYRYELESDYVKLGYIRTAFGYDLMALPQVANWESPFGLLLDDAKLWIISPSSQKLVKVVLEGATMSNTTAPFQMANLTQSTTLFKSWGTGIATNAAAGIITLS